MPMARRERLRSAEVRAPDMTNEHHPFPTEGRHDISPCQNCGFGKGQIDDDLKVRCQQCGEVQPGAALEEIVVNDEDNFVVAVSMTEGVLHTFHFTKGVGEMWLDKMVQQGETYRLAKDEIPPGIEALAREESGLKVVEG